MRFIGIVMIIAGLYLGLAKPWVKYHFTGDKFAQTIFFDKAKSNNGTKGWDVAKVFLQKENNPIRIRINAYRLPGQIYDNGKLKLLVRVAPISQDGSAMPAELNQQVTLNLENTTSNPLPGTKAKLITKATSSFEISRTGQYKIGAFPIPDDNVSNSSPDLKIDTNIIRIDAVVLGNVEEVSSGGSSRGIILAILGFGVLVISSRKKSKSKSKRVAKQPAPSAPKVDVPPAKRPVETVKHEPKVEPPKPEPKPEPKTKVGKTIKWGRDAGKKR